MRKSIYLVNLLSLLPLQRRLNCIVLVLISLVMAGSARAQENSPVEKTESDIELLIRAEADIQEMKKTPLRELIFAQKADRILKSILQRHPDSSFRFQVLEDSKPVHEILGSHSLQVATFYMRRGHGHSLKGAESRLLQIVQEYPAFSKMDEVLLGLGTIALQEERPDEAARYLWKLVCNYPDSDYSRIAFEQLNGIGFRLW